MATYLRRLQLWRRVSETGGLPRLSSPIDYIEPRGVMFAMGQTDVKYRKKPSS